MIPFIGLLVWALCLPKKIYIDLDYDFEDNNEIETKYNNNINEVLDYLMSCDKVWEVHSTTANENIKQHAGARSLLGLNSNVKLVEDVKYVNTNINLKMLDIQNKKILFLPDTILVLEDNVWISVNYEDFEIEYSDSRFIESGNVPNDTEILEIWHL